jgi:hypothetical protein
MKWYATVRSATGQVRHYVGPVARHDGTLGGALMPSAVRVEIEEDQTGTGNFFLLRYGPKDEFAGDTWHQTLDEAKGQAEFEFGILASDWREVVS